MPTEQTVTLALVVSAMIAVVWYAKMPKKYALLGIFFFLAFIIGQYWPAEVDDTFIYGRYGHNLRQDGVLAFNGRESTEGYASLLWVVVAAFGGLIGDSIIVLKVCAIIAGISLIYLLDHEFSRYRLSRINSGLLFIGLIGTAMTGFWLQVGMETSIYTLLLTAAVIFLLRDIERKDKYPISGVLFGLLGVTRPEAFGHIAIAAVIIVLRWITTDPKRLRQWLTVAIGIPTVNVLFRAHVFSELLPLPAIAKGGVFGKNYELGWQYVYKTLLAFPLVPALGTLGIVPAIYLALKKRWGQLVVYAPLLFVVGQVFFAIFVRGDWMPFGRFLFPIYPLLCVIAIRWMSAFFSQGRDRVIPAFIIGSMIVGCVFQIQQIIPSLNDAFWGAPLTIGNFAQCLKSAGVKMETVAIEDIGMFGYYSDLEIVDRHGLVHRDIAHYNRAQYPGDTNEQRLGQSELILERNPGYAIGVMYWNSTEEPDFSKYLEMDKVPRYNFPDGTGFEHIGTIAVNPVGVSYSAIPRYFLVYRRAGEPEDIRWESCIDSSNALIGVSEESNWQVSSFSNQGTATFEEAIFAKHKLIKVLFE